MTDGGQIMYQAVAPRWTSDLALSGSIDIALYLNIFVIKPRGDPNVTVLCVFVFLGLIAHCACTCMARSGMKFVEPRYSIFRAVAVGGLPARLVHKSPRPPPPRGQNCQNHITAVRYSSQKKGPILPSNPAPHSINA